MSNLTTFIPLPEEDNAIAKMLNHLVRRAAETRSDYLEQLAAAYCLKTGLDPRDVELVEDHRVGKIVWYFRPRQAGRRLGTGNAAQTRDESGSSEL